MKSNIVLEILEAFLNHLINVYRHDMSSVVRKTFDLVSNCELLLIGIKHGMCAL